MKNINIGILAAWKVVEFEGDYYIPSMHYVYLEYLCSHFKYVYLISPHHIKISEEPNFKKINFENLILLGVPAFSNYIGAIKHINSYVKCINRIKTSVDYFYSRVPDPYSWLPSLLTKKCNIFHFVGDSIEVIQNNVKLGRLKKLVLILGYLPDYILTLIFASRSKVYTNGPHLAQKMRNRGVKAIEVISSTVKAEDLPTSLPSLSDGCVKLIYIGYLRYSKGLNTLMKLLLKMKNHKLKYEFDIVGSGEYYNELLDFVEKNNLSNNIHIHGHIDSRKKIYELLKKSDIFYFPSLSEGSPRVVIEAMSQGVPVIATRVGSLPYCFKDNESIKFVDFDDVDTAFEVINNFVNDNSCFYKQRNMAYGIVKKNYTVDSFMSKIFSNDKNCR